MKNGKVGIAFKILLRTTGDKEIWTRAAIVSDEPIQQNLADILVHLCPYVVEMLELPVKEENRIQVTGAEFTETKKESIFGAQIYALRKLDHSSIPQEIVTPHKTEIPYDDGNRSGDTAEGATLDSDCVELLKALQQETERYIHGQKDQLGIFDQVPKSELSAASTEKNKKLKSKRSKKEG